MLHVRIKKKFFDSISIGEKVFEYRDTTEFYKKLFAKNPKKIIFHYQSKDRLIVDVKDIKIIPLPERFKESPFFKNQEIFQIAIENPVRFSALFFKNK